MHGSSQQARNDAGCHHLLKFPKRTDEVKTPKTFVRILLFVSGAMLLSACGGNVKVAMPMNQSAEQKMTDQKAAVRMVKASAADVPSHFLLAVKGHVENELNRRGMLANGSADSAHQIDVNVTYYRMRTGFTRMMFGVLAGKDGIEGDVTVHDAATGEVISRLTASSFNIMAVGSEDDVARMFAEQVAMALENRRTGTN
jgi:hypothetical protein